MQTGFFSNTLSTETKTGLTRLDLVENIYIKRDDEFTVAGVVGGKARSCWYLATRDQSTRGFVTAGSRHSPQIQIMAHIADHLRKPFSAHTATGEMTDELVDAEEYGAEIVRHRPGYNSVIIKRAIDFSTRSGYLYIPFGMECWEAVNQTRQQARSLVGCPARNLVVPVGSGMSLAGILWGLKDNGLTLPVVGVIVGADPEKRLDKYAPPMWRGMVKLLRSFDNYSRHREGCRIGNVDLDPVYEAKCLPFINKGDCLWIVGIRRK